MQLEDYFDFNAEPVENIRIKGTRIGLEHVIELYKSGMTPDQIAVHFGRPVAPVKVFAAITYYLQNKDEVEAYLARGDEIARVAQERYWASLTPERREQQIALRKRIQELKTRFTDENGRLDIDALKEYRAHRSMQPDGVGV
ncbi:MAG TPA: DUF433 domain-containing protein [Urbifossiella sp.]|jgi:uncharacterized protein (DUF433 family)